MMRMIKNRVYDRVEEMRECLDARTSSMTTKESTMRERERDWRKKKNRSAVLTLRQDWVEQETALHCKDKRKGKKTEKERER